MTPPFNLLKECPSPRTAGAASLGSAKMDYFEEPPEWTEKPEPSEASMELVMLLTKNMTRVMDLFRKVRRRRPLMPARSPAANRAESVLRCAVGHEQ